MDEDVVADLFRAFGAVRLKRMFGGAGLYADGLMFAIEANDVIYLKSDKMLAADLEARGAAPFSYVAKGVVRTMGGFWSVPDDALDDADDLAGLARRALAVAREADAAKARKPVRGRGASKGKDEGKAGEARHPAAGKAKPVPRRGGA